MHHLCMHTHMHISIYIITHAYQYIHAHRNHLYIHIHMHISIYIITHAYQCTSAHTSSSYVISAYIMIMCTYISTHASFSHTYAHMHIDTYTILIYHLHIHTHHRAYMEIIHITHVLTFIQCAKFAWYMYQRNKPPRICTHILLCMCWFNTFNALI